MSTSDSQQAPPEKTAQSDVSAQARVGTTPEAVVPVEPLPAASPPPQIEAQSAPVDAPSFSATPTRPEQGASPASPAPTQQVLTPPQPAADLAATKQPMPLLTRVQILAALLVLMTPVVYFNGHAFHDGWYEYFHLDPAMFPLDTAGTLTWGTVAWGNLLIQVVTIFKQVELKRWLLPMSMIAGGAVAGALMAWGSDHWKAVKAKRGNRPISGFWKKIRFVASLVLWPIAAMALFTLAIYALIFVLMFVLAIMSAPFYSLGAAAAQKAAANGFVDRPVVTVTTQTRAVEQREMACGPQFCALWANKHAGIVPISAVTAGDAPTPVSFWTVAVVGTKQPYMCNECELRTPLPDSASAQALNAWKSGQSPFTGPVDPYDVHHTLESGDKVSLCNHTGCSTYIWQEADGWTQGIFQRKETH